MFVNNLIEDGKEEAKDHKLGATEDADPEEWNRLPSFTKFPMVRDFLRPCGFHG